MKISELKGILAEHEQKKVRFRLPTGSSVPPHAHVTEVAQVDKRFIDCGGTARTESLCRLQTWFADDTEHRLTAGKLLKILELSRGIIEDESLEVEIEHEAPFISQFPIESTEVKGDGLVLVMGVKHTDCLAKDRCAPPKEKGGFDFMRLPAIKETACCGGGC